MENYEYDKPFTYGSDGLIYKVKRKGLDQEYVMKEGPPFGNDDDDAGDGYGLPKEFVRELTSLKTLTPHPCIISLMDMPRKKGSQLGFNLIVELMDMDLDEFITKRKDEDGERIPINTVDVEKIMYQILLGVAHCHKNGIMHRDLKPANVMINTESLRVKIADFGVARSPVPSMGTYSPRVTTKIYSAPEILECDGDTPYSYAADMWSVGCIFAEVVLQESAFSGEEIGELLKNIRGGLGISGGTKLLCDRIDSYLNGNGLDLLFQLLQFEPSKRISASAALDHTFFDRVDKPLYEVGE